MQALGEKLATLRRAVGALHLVALVVPLVFLGAGLANAVGAGFEPSRESYGPDNFPLPDHLQKLVKRIPGGARPGKDALAVWGLVNQAGETPDETSLGCQVTRALVGAGFEVRVHDPSDAEAARAALADLGEQVVFTSSPLEAAEDAFALYVCREHPDYTHPPLERTHAAMRSFPPPKRPQLFDCVGMMDSTSAFAAGFLYIPFGGPSYPAWRDPEFREFLTYLEERVPEDAGVLLIPLGPPRTWAARARWFLFLNYYLAPRRLYLPDAHRASGTVTQYQDWLAELMASFRGPPDTPLLSDADLSTASRRTGSRYELRYRVQSDFQFGDWELTPLY